MFEPSPRRSKREQSRSVVVNHLRLWSGKHRFESGRDYYEGEEKVHQRARVDRRIVRRLFAPQMSHVWYKAHKND